MEDVIDRLYIVYHWDQLRCVSKASQQEHIPQRALGISSSGVVLIVCCCLLSRPLDGLEIFPWGQSLFSLIRSGKLSHEFACAVAMVATTFPFVPESPLDRIVMVRIRASRWKRNNILLQHIIQCVCRWECSGSPPLYSVPYVLV